MKASLILDELLSLTTHDLEACFQATIETYFEQNEIWNIYSISHSALIKEWASTTKYTVKLLDLKQDLDIPESLLPYYYLYQACHYSDIVIILSKYSGVDAKRSPIIYQALKMLVNSKCPHILYKIK